MDSIYVNVEWRTIYVWPIYAHKITEFSHVRSNLVQKVFSVIHWLQLKRRIFYILCWLLFSLSCECACFHSFLSPFMSCVSIFFIHDTRARYTIKEHLNHATTILCTKMLLFRCFTLFASQQDRLLYKIQNTIYINCSSPSSFGKSWCSHLCNYSLTLSSSCGVLYVIWPMGEQKTANLNVLCVFIKSDVQNMLSISHILLYIFNSSPWLWSKTPCKSSHTI